jgi:hypothetical protein
VEAQASTTAGSGSIDGGRGRMRAGNELAERKGEWGRGRLRTPYVPAGGPPMLGHAAGAGNRLAGVGNGLVPPLMAARTLGAFLRYCFSMRSCARRRGGEQMVGAVLLYSGICG